MSSSKHLASPSIGRNYSTLVTKSLRYISNVSAQITISILRHIKNWFHFQKLHGFLGCLIFHDVDLIPLDGRNIYGCLRGPRQVWTLAFPQMDFFSRNYKKYHCSWLFRALHMSAHLDNFRFNLPYEGLFGGAVAVEQSIFEDANGFSNKFYGIIS